MIYSRYSDFRAAFATSSTPDASGYEEWPLAKVRSGGFTGGFRLADGNPLPKPITSFPLNITVNANADDAVIGTHDYRWFLSQRTETAASQYLALTHGNSSKSGTVTLSLTTLGNTTFDTDDPPDGIANINEDALIGLLKHCSLYVQRVSDDAIQVVHLLTYTLSS